MRNGWYLPVGERAPEPFERAEAEMAEPDGADDENDEPDGGDDVIKLVALELAEEAEAVAFENGGADERRENVIGKGHAADVAERGRDGAERAEFDEQHDYADVSKRGEAAEFVCGAGEVPCS